MAGHLHFLLANSLGGFKMVDTIVGLRNKFIIPLGLLGALGLVVSLSQFASAENIDFTLKARRRSSSPWRLLVRRSLTYPGVRGSPALQIAGPPVQGVVH